MSDGFSRRRAVRTGAVGIAITIAGCGSSEDGDDGDGGNGGDGGEGNGSGPIEPGTRIDFDGITAGWEGLAPSAIEGLSNPTLSLVEGEPYEMGWSQGDGATHNIAIYDESDAVVDDLQTDIVSEPGDGQWLEFEASGEMVTYICEVHPTTMIGDIEVQSE
ncbi:cupredoxin domain-containing protein [Halovivax limisalsi]|uniref:cupredoxin domain-containing protein n=1 Tax=Halovivax limisalsi TaxID=1453760 RepID=UPI001FFC58FB|nr:PKD domain-containing protein [Halovivax limisalsi]